jgi:hypothetical protein
VQTKAPFGTDGVAVISNLLSFSHLIILIAVFLYLQIFKYSSIASTVCMRQTIGPVMTEVELANASSQLRYSRSIVCMRQTIGPVMTEVELAKASIWLRYSRGSVCRKQTTGRVMTGVELRHTEGPRVALDLRHPEGPRVASDLFERYKWRQIVSCLTSF